MARNLESDDHTFDNEEKEERLRYFKTESGFDYYQKNLSRHYPGYDSASDSDEEYNEWNDFDLDQEHDAARNWMFYGSPTLGRSLGWAICPLLKDGFEDVIRFQRMQGQKHYSQSRFDYVWNTDERGWAPAFMNANFYWFRIINAYTKLNKTTNSVQVKIQEDRTLVNCC
eukprot:gb/GECH01011025.1/.p1 GENE.gb/GECH01011025.1/~~gb/GECH01011025.1/.p1  ORF type:complete len:170 (+),score=53.99 gb/GECH01011025.1/:1-510(+)